MSTHVVGIVPPDEDWRAQKAVWDACVAAGVEIPQRTLAFFDGETPDPSGVVYHDIRKREWLGGGTGHGYEVDLADGPKSVKTLRFYNSW